MTQRKKDIKLLKEINEAIKICKQNEWIALFHYLENKAAQMERKIDETGE